MPTHPFLAAVTVVGLTALPCLAHAASSETHVMTVQLPDGLTAEIQYIGDVPPKVVFGGPASDVAFPAADAAFIDPFAMLQRMSAEMFNAVNAMETQPFAGMTEAALPSGANFCSRSVEITYGGPGQAPHVVTHTAGNCGSAVTTAAPAQPREHPTNPIEIRGTSQPFQGLVREVDWRR